MKKIFSVLLGVLVVSLFFLSCSSDKMETAEFEERGMISITIGQTITKTIWPYDWVEQIDRYAVILLKDGTPLLGEPVIIDPENIGEEYVFNDLEPGSDYKVMVSAENENDEMIGFGEAEDITVTGGSKTDVTVRVYPLSDDPGAFAITLKWPHDLEDPVDKITAQRRMIGDVEWSDLEDDFDLSSYEILYEIDPVDAGSHLVRFLLFNSEEELISSVIEVVNVFSNITTVGTIELAKEDFVEGGAEPEYPEERVKELNDGDLEFWFRNHAEYATNSPLYLPGTYNGWDSATVFISFDSPDSDLLIADAVDGEIQFKICNDNNWDCWDFYNFIEWTIIGAVLDDMDKEQIIIEAGDGDAVLVVVDVANITITVYHDDRQIPDDKGEIEVTIETDDMIPDEDLEIEWSADGDSRTFSSSYDHIEDYTYSWFFNGVLIEGENDSEIEVDVSQISVGDRISLVISGGQFAYSAQITITQEIIDGIE